MLAALRIGVGRASCGRLANLRPPLRRSVGASLISTVPCFSRMTTVGVKTSLEPGKPSMHSMFVSRGRRCRSFSSVPSYKTFEEIKQRLKEGNNRYVADVEDLKSNADLRASLKGGQSPFAIVLSCADSRVVPEMIFDCNIGELFVVRVAGNIANSSSIASIEYAVSNLGCKYILVLGHEACGAVNAAIAGGDNGKHLNHLCSHIEEAVHTSSSKETTDVVKLNATINANGLLKNSPIISDLVENKQVEIGAGFYAFDGTVEFL
jgi:carbonic anhydrase